MSFAVARNTKHKMANMPSIGRHNERRNAQYGNKDIDISRSHENYHFKEPVCSSYEKEFERIRTENDLKGKLRLTGKKQSTVACEFIFTSDKNFFDSLAPEREKNFFKAAYDFACQKCGEKNIISAVVHKDETTPHMHLVYIPVVQKTNKKGVTSPTINCSEFWKGFNSYGKFQDEWYSFITARGFDLERGLTGTDRQHLAVEDFKNMTNFVEQQAIGEKIALESPKLPQKGILGQYKVQEVEQALEAIQSLTNENKQLKQDKIRLSGLIQHSDTAALKERCQTAEDELKKMQDRLSALELRNRNLESQIEVYKILINKMREWFKNVVKWLNQKLTKATGLPQKEARETINDYMKETKDLIPRFEDVIRDTKITHTRYR